MLSACTFNNRRSSSHTVIDRLLICCNGRMPQQLAESTYYFQLLNLLYSHAGLSAFKADGRTAG